MARASLPMYDFPEVRDATLAWWAGLARAFRRAGVPDVPDRLAQGEEAAALGGPGAALHADLRLPADPSLSPCPAPCRDPRICRARLPRRRLCQRRRRARRGPGRRARGPARPGLRHQRPGRPIPAATSCAAPSRRSPKAGASSPRSWRAAPTRGRLPRCARAWPTWRPSIASLSRCWRAAGPRPSPG